MRFLVSERGGLLPFTLVVLGTVILIGALAVNTVRVEHSRSVAQSVLDICVLNAAAQRQSLPPREVLDDCLQKHGFEATIDHFEAVTGRTKSVTATADMAVGSLFLQDPVIYDIGVASTAAETFTNLEIVLALDVSASMNLASPISPHPLTDLKAAARQFVQTILAEDTQGNIKLAIVPYNSHVNLGSTIGGEFSMQNRPFNLMIGTTRIGPDVTEHRCADLPPSLYASSAIGIDTVMPAMPFVDTLGATRQQNARTAHTDANFAVATLQENLCSFFRLNPSPATNNVVFPPDFGSATLGTPQQRIDALQAKITGLVGTAETSINVGMRWALAFLDPAMRDIYQGLRYEELVPPSIEGHPRAFDDPTAIKVIVLMSDGTNQPEDRMPPQFSVGPSPFWIGNDGNISWHNPLRPGPDQYWVPHVVVSGAPAGTAPGIWQSTPWRNATNSGAAARQLDYTEVWRRMKVRYVAWEFHARSVNQASGTTVAQRAANNAARQAAFEAAMAQYLPPAQRISAATKNEQLTQVCNLARGLNVYVYTLLFETETTNSPVLESCAREPSYFYRAGTPGALTQAFSDIALHISRLQLTE